MKAIDASETNSKAATFDSKQQNTFIGSLRANVAAFEQGVAGREVEYSDVLHFAVSVLNWLGWASLGGGARRTRARTNVAFRRRALSHCGSWLQFTAWEVLLQLRAADRNFWQWRSLLALNRHISNSGNKYRLGAVDGDFCKLDAMDGFFCGLGGLGAVVGFNSGVHRFGAENGVFCELGGLGAVNGVSGRLRVQIHVHRTGGIGVEVDMRRRRGVER